MPTQALRNVAIIAHVDHGKTTLVDRLLYQSGMFRSEALDKLAGGQHGLIMDSNPLERERGITILSKNCAVTYSGEGGSQTRINIIDTPGHADFGGEVERVLRMADGCLLLVDAYEGPMPQTRFVLAKAIAAGLEPIVVINKCDRPDARPQQVINMVFDLLVELGADDHALDFPVVFASARNGWATRDLDQPTDDLRAVFEAIIENVPPAGGDAEAPTQMQITTLDYSEYVGRIGIGRVRRGTVRRGQSLVLMPREGGPTRRVRIGQVHAFEGLGRREVDAVSAGDLCAIYGVEGIDIGDTLADPDHAEALPAVAIDEPTLKMVFRVNDSPFAGREGDYVTSRQVRDRLLRECETNVALKVEAREGGDEFDVAGRGMLHLGVLIEQMRREGYELAAGKPKVILREVDGKLSEPVERLIVDCPNDAVGAVMEMVGSRRGVMTTMDPHGDARTQLEFDIPARGLIGLRTRVMNASAGEAIMHHAFLRFEPVGGDIVARQQGVMIASEGGKVTAYAIEGLADRGVMFVKPGEDVYTGMIIGEHARDNDLTVNITRAKQMTNFREANKESFVRLKASRDLSLEQCLEYIEEDELVEITPKSVRMRKRLLQESDRRKAERSSRDKAGAGV